MQDNYNNKIVFIQEVNFNINVTNINIVANNSDKETKKEQEEREQEKSENKKSDEEDNINDNNGKYLPFKRKTEILEKIYQELKDYKCAELAHNCGTYMEFVLYKKQQINEKKLHKINSCRMRLCPYCQYRKSLKMYSNMRKIYDYLIQTDSQNNNHKSRFIFITLTTRNCTLENLSSEVELILHGFANLWNRKNKKFRAAFAGYSRSLEITIDRERYITAEMYHRKKSYYDKKCLKIGDLNDNYLMCNVHVHALMHTYRDTYSANYITQQKLTNMWRFACNLDYVPIVDIRVFRAKNLATRGREIAELVKYTVKPIDYLKSYEINQTSKDCQLEFELDKKIVQALDNALYKRRLYSTGGTIRRVGKTLKLSDEIEKKEMFKELDKLEQEGEIHIIKYYYSWADRIYKRKR